MKGARGGLDQVTKSIINPFSLSLNHRRGEPCVPLPPPVTTLLASSWIPSQRGVAREHARVLQSFIWLRIGSSVQRQLLGTVAGARLWPAGLITAVDRENLSPPWEE